MKTIFLLSIALTASVLKAETIESRVHSIENNIVRFDNGRVAFLDSKNQILPPKGLIKAELDERSSLLSYEQIEEATFLENKSLFLVEDPEPTHFEPSIVQGMDEAWNIFNRSNPYYKRISECFDRAHIWAHDEYKKSGTKSQKAFVFFTASYINSVRFKWWFHVAPLYHVNVGGQVKKLVMDYRYTDRPMTVKEWTDQFVYTKRPCKVTTKFSEYDVNPQTENCYLIFESMHYKIPADIHSQETQGHFKNSTSDLELQTSFNNAFVKKLAR
jgi:hypothetical protein